MKEMGATLKEKKNSVLSTSAAHFICMVPLLLLFGKSLMGWLGHRTGNVAHLNPALIVQVFSGIGIVASWVLSVVGTWTRDSIYSRKQLAFPLSVVFLNLFFYLSQYLNQRMVAKL